MRYFALSLVLLFLTIDFLVYTSNKLAILEKADKSNIIRLVRNEKTFCSGTIVTPHTIITAAHCTVEEALPGVTYYSKTPIEIRRDDNIPLGVIATPYYQSPQLDHALLVGDFSTFHPRNYITDIKTINDHRKSTTQLTACGYPLGGDMYCSQLQYEELHDFFWTVAGLLLPGMSGGPVMLQDGTVIGVNTAVEGPDSIISPIYNLNVEIVK